MQSFLHRRPLELVRLDLLQQFALVVVNVKIEIPLRRPLPWRKEQHASIDAAVAQNPQQHLSGILRRGKFDPNVFDVLEGLRGQNLCLDVPTFSISHDLLIHGGQTTHQGEMTFTRLP